MALGISGCPIRKKFRALKSDGFDCRAAQDHAALIPRDGKRYSGHEENPADALGIAKHSDSAQLATPEYIDVEIMLSRARTHVNVTFKNARSKNKISFRPERRHSAARKLAGYNDSVFMGETREGAP